MPTLVNAGPECDPWGRALKVILQRERREREREIGVTFWYENVSLDEKSN